MSIENPTNVQQTFLGLYSNKKMFAFISFFSLTTLRNNLFEPFGKIGKVEESCWIKLFYRYSSWPCTYKGKEQKGKER